MKNLVLLVFLCTAVISFADDTWDEVRFSRLKGGMEYEISSGTGFYVNDENIITNRHVVKNCKNIAIRGAVAPQLATLILVDENLDLALLKAKSPPVRVPYLRINYDVISAGDILFTVGYPLDRSKTGEYLIKEAQVITIKDHTDKTNFTNIQFTDTVNHGNSGGPLLDRSSNIVGVVTAKLTRYSADDPDNKESFGFAIGLDGLFDFLKRNNITYSSNATYDIFTNYNVDKAAQDYVVNIHCVQSEVTEGDSKDTTSEVTNSGD